MENDNDIRKKEKKLDSNHWMCKIQKYVLGIDAENYYIGYCPFFWMTILCIFLFPFILTWRIVITILAFVGGLLGKLFEEKLHKKIEENRKNKQEELRKIPMLPMDYIIVNIFNNEERYIKNEYDLKHMVSYSDYTGTIPWTNCIRMGLWFEQNPNWKETHYPCAKQRIEEARLAHKKQEELDRECEKKREAFKRKMIMKGAFCGKLIFKVAVVALLAVLAAGIYWGVYKVITTVNPLVFLQVAYMSCGIIAALMVIKMLVTELIYFIDNTESSSLFYKDEDNLRLIFKPFAFLFNVIVSIVKGIGKVFCFIKEAIGMLYKEECPLIIWGEETGPIEKRNKENAA